MKPSLKKFILTVPLCLSLCGGSVLAQDAAGADEATLAKRAKAYGALAHLPTTTEGAFAIRDLSGMFDAVAKSNFLARILELAGEGGEGADGVIAQIRQGIATYAGEEVIVAYADGSANELKRLMSLYDVYVRTTYGMLGRAVGGADFNGVGPEQMVETVKKSLADPDSELSKALDNIQVPPMIIGSKMGDAAGAVVAQLDEMESNLPPFVTVASFEAGDTTFKSWSINLKDVFDENMQAQMEEALDDKKLSDRLAKVIRSKRIEMSFGAIGNYLVVGIGKNHAHLNFIDNPAESVVSLPQFAKADSYLGKHIHGYAYFSKELLETDNSAQMIESMADSFVEGMAAAGASGPMKKLGEHANKLASQLARISSRKASDYLGIMYGEKGLRGEGFGGWVMDAVDGKAKLTFANSDIKDAFLIFNSASNPKYDQLGIEMIENLASAVNAGMRAYGEMSGDESTVEKYMEMKKVFGPKVEKIWDILANKFFAGLGNESALVMDLHGTLPKIPGVPRAIVNQGKAPRIAAIHTVKNRKLLSQAWDELVPALNDLMAAIPGQEKGAEVQLPDTITSTKEGLATHYFGLPFLSNDFMPSLSISDKLFFLSTSKKFSESLAEKAGKGTGNIRGTYFRIDFIQLNDFAQSWLDLVLKNTATIFEGNEFAAEDFEEGAEIAKVVFKLTRALKSFEYNKHTTDANEGRSSWHLHLEDVK